MFILLGLIGFGNYHDFNFILIVIVLLGIPCILCNPSHPLGTPLHATPPPPISIIQQYNGTHLMAGWIELLQRVINKKE